MQSSEGPDRGVHFLGQRSFPSHQPPRTAKGSRGKFQSTCRVCLVALDSRPFGLYHHQNKFVLTFIRWADLNFMQSG